MSISRTLTPDGSGYNWHVEFVKKLLGNHFFHTISSKNVYLSREMKTKIGAHLIFFSFYFDVEVTVGNKLENGTKCGIGKLATLTQLFCFRHFQIKTKLFIRVCLRF